MLFGLVKFDILIIRINNTGRRNPVKIGDCAATVFPCEFSENSFG